MKRVFLTSSVNFVAKDIVKNINRSASELSLAFVNTAAEVEKGDLWWLRNDRNALIKQGFKLFDYSLVDKKESEIKKDLENTDVIFLSSGNTFYLLEQIRKSGFDKLVPEFTNQEKIFIGSSAGSVVMGPDIEIIKEIDDPSQAKELKSFKGLGLVDFIILPHWGNDHFKKGYLKTMAQIYEEGRKIILLADHQYVMVEEDTYKIIQVE